MGASLSSFWVLRFRFVGASFSSFGCSVFEFWVLRFRDLGQLRASVFVFECFVFETTGHLGQTLSIERLLSPDPIKDCFRFDLSQG